MGGVDPQKFIGLIPELINRVKLLANGTISIFTGLGKEIVGVAEGGTTLVDHGLTVMEYLIVFAATYLSCSVYFLSRLRNCMIYYLLEIVGQILYLPVRIFVWFLKLIRLIDLQPHVDKFWEYMEKLDRYVYTYCKFHIIHYPRSVRENCYVCKRLKMSSLGEQIGVLADDFGPDGVGKNMVAGANDLYQGFMDFMGVFAPLL